jgi:polyhydroxybutyrate depolymerase
MLACNESETFAAVASITGAMTPQMFDNCNPTNPVPVLQFHADEDGTVPYEGNESWTMGIPKVINFWVDHNGASDSPIITAIDDVAPNDGSTVERFEYKASESYAPVIHYFVKGGGHDWPGAWGNKDISASELVWDFFSEYNNNGTR